MIINETCCFLFVSFVFYVCVVHMIWYDNNVYIFNMNEFWSPCNQTPIKKYFVLLYVIIDVNIIVTTFGPTPSAGVKKNSLV